MDKSGKIIGILIFILGIAILLFVFFTAYIMFNSPTPGLSDQPASAKITVNSLGYVFSVILIKLLLLFVMTLAGSLIAARGIGLYSGSSSIDINKNLQKISGNKEL